MMEKNIPKKLLQDLNNRMSYSKEYLISVAEDGKRGNNEIIVFDNLLQ